MQDITIKQRGKVFKMSNYAKARLYHVPQYANCNDNMQYMKLSQVQNYAGCQFMQSKKLWNVKKYSKCKANHGAKNANFKYLWKTKVMKGAKLCKIQNKSMCIYMQNAKLICMRS